MRLLSFGIAGMILLATLSNSSVMGQSRSYYGTSIQSTSDVTTPWTTPSGEAFPLSVEKPKGRTAEFTTTDTELNRPSLLLVQGVEDKKATQLRIIDSTKSEVPASTVNISEPIPAMNVRTEILGPEAILGPRSQTPGNNQYIDLPDGSKVPVSSKRGESNLQRFNAPGTNNSTILSTENNLNVLPINNQNRNLSPLQTGTVENRTEVDNVYDPFSVNPYSGVGRNHCLSKEYYPGFISSQSCSEPAFRTTPPVEAYGNDFSGNSICFSNLCPTLAYTLQNTQFEVGVLGFRNPVNLIDQGNFGVDLNLNWSTPSKILWGLSGQAGGRISGTTLSGKIEGYNFSQDRTQFFLTTGFFYRDPANCWQMGAVYDSMRDSNYEKYTLGQARVEISRKICTDLDFGFRGAFAINDKLVNLWSFNSNNQKLDTIEDHLAPVSWYTGFFRKYFECGGEGMIFCGATEYGDTMAGGQMEVPISNNASLRNSCTYVFNNSKSGKSNTFFENTWSFSASFVFYLGGNSRESMKNPLRPLFEVADNGSFLQNYK